MANVRFATGLIPNLAYHHIFIVLLLCSVILFSLVLAGCTSSTSSILNLYLVSLSYQQGTPLNSSSQVNPNLTATFNNLVNGTSLEVRTGYFGLCVSYAGGIWICSSDSAGLSRQFQPYQDPLNLIWASQKFKDSIVFSGLIIAAIALVVIAMGLLSTFPGWHQETNETGSEVDVKPFPSRPVSNLTLAASVLATLLALVSMMWQHTASVAVATTVQDMGYGTIKSEVGAMAMALGWVGLGCVVVPAIGVAVMVLSIRFLDALTDD